MLRVRYNGHYYSAPLGKLLAILADSERELAKFTNETGKRAAYEARRKRTVIAKLKDAIRSRIAWHRSEIDKAAAAGFTAGPEHQPRARSIRYPERRRRSGMGASA
jgi:hypothetical protein